jgi:hypothetical protein
LSAEALKAGHAILATMVALLVTGVTLAVLLTAQLAASDAADGKALYLGEILSTLLYLLILGTALTVAFGTLPFAALMLLLMRLRTNSLLAFIVGGAVAGTIAAVAFVLVMHSGDMAKALGEFRKLAFADLSGVAVLAASAFGALVARRYLIRRQEVGPG